MTTSPADPPKGAGRSGQGLKLLAVTACPTGIAHTYMAAEKLTQAAESLGHEMKVETQGSIGVENVLSDNDVSRADGVIIAADKDVDPARFVGKRLLVVGVAEGIRHPEELIERVRSAPVYGTDGAGAGTGSGAEAGGGAGGRSGVAGTAGARSGGSGRSGARSGGGVGAGGSGGKERGLAYKALMNGVSYMIPFVVVGGLLLALSLAVGGQATPKGLVIPEGTFWAHVNDIGTIGFQLMVPILSGYIAYAIGDRPALVPGMISGWIANTGELYGSEAGAGFIGAIVTGFLAGYLVLGIKKVRVPRFVRPIMPIIVIPIVATAVLGLFFIYVLGKPISWVFTHLTDWLSGMTGTSAIALGAVLGLMIAFDMGGPVNKTAFLFGTGLIATGNQTVMGMCAAAIPVMPLGQGLATLIRRRLYSDQERETGMAALFMGLFGISEGAIPFAAARPAQVIPANMLGGAVAGAVAGMAGVTDAVPHGGPIVAILGAVGGVPMFFVAVAAGAVVTALVTVALVDVSARQKERAAAEGRTAAGEIGADPASGLGTGSGPVPAGVGAAGVGVAAAAGAAGAAGAMADEGVVTGATGGMAVGAAGVAAAGSAGGGGAGVGNAEGGGAGVGNAEGGGAGGGSAGAGAGSTVARVAGSARGESGLVEGAGAGEVTGGEAPGGVVPGVGTSSTSDGGSPGTSGGGSPDVPGEGTSDVPDQGSSGYQGSSGAGTSGGEAPAGGALGAEPRGSEPRGSEPRGKETRGTEPKGALPKGAESKGAEPDGAELEGTESGGVEAGGGEPGGEVLSGYLSRETVKVRLAADGKEAAIREMAELAARTGKVADVEELVRVALAREAQGTTGLGEEIAIPHAKTDAVTAPVVGFARSTEGIDWDSLDGTRAKLVFMISVPEAAAGDEHLRILALLSRKLMDADFRARLRNAPDETAILRVLSEVG